MSFFICGTFLVNTTYNLINNHFKTTLTIQIFINSPMCKNPEYKLLYFYSNYNQESIKTRESINTGLVKYGKQINITYIEVNYDKEANKGKYFDITGTPALLIFVNGKVVSRFYGELRSNEIENVFRYIIDKFR